MPTEKASKKLYLMPLLLVLALLVLFAMVRLGFWQLDRAEQKQYLLNQVQQRAVSPAQSPERLIERLSSGERPENLRFQAVEASGQYLSNQSILIENQVLNNRGGYQVITPFKVVGLDQLLMVSRGWVAAGATRKNLPKILTPDQRVRITGRLNMPPAKPPLWKDGYPVNEVSVWQYLPIDEYALQIGAEVLPLVVELSPENEGADGLTVRWQSINDNWVAKHKGYAFQWFAMAIGFFTACLVLLVRNRSANMGFER